MQVRPMKQSIIKRSYWREKVLALLIPLVSSTLWHPAAAAERNTAPRFPGSLTLSQISVKGKGLPNFSSGNVKWAATGRLNMAAMRDHARHDLTLQIQIVDVWQYLIYNLPITSCEVSRSDQNFVSSILTFTRLTPLRLSRGSSLSAFTELKKTFCATAPASRAQRMRCPPSRITLPWCSRSFLDRAMLTSLLHDKTHFLI